MSATAMSASNAINLRLFNNVASILRATQLTNYVMTLETSTTQKKIFYSYLRNANPEFPSKHGLGFETTTLMAQE